ncbi:DUF7373 family lipoprotein [Nocardia camponoti]|uniref:DUF7373 family lipoprotein n=1 Tax=Nocardia camponoti TaxID=1616106 RepID=UPI00166D7AC8|nr:hypothetical protein [Nocardia camponoti]
MRSRLRRVAVLAPIIVGLLVGCGGAPVTPDYGGYSIERAEPDYDAGQSRARGILVESLRLGERISFADQIDPDLTTTGGGGVLGDHRNLVPGMNLLSGVQSNVASKLGVRGSFGTIANNGRSNDREEKFLSIALLAFDSEDVARTATADMARADFEQGGDNVSLPLPEHPGALSHYRPSVPTVGSWLTWKNLVIRVYAKVLEPRPELLADILTKTYRAQLADLDGFVPTAQSELASLRIDPDRLLTRMVRTEEPQLSGDTGPSTFAVYGPRAFSLLSPHPSAFLAKLRAASVSQVAVAHNKYLWHTASSQAAEAEAARLVIATEGDYLAMAGVSGLPTVSCGQRKIPEGRNAQPSRLRCIVHRGPDVVTVLSYLAADARQLAAAQYALLGQDR